MHKTVSNFKSPAAILVIQQMLQGR